jgi:hypothetical protein
MLDNQGHNNCHDDIASREEDVDKSDCIVNFDGLLVKVIIDD